MRRKASPSDGAAEAKLVEFGEVVVADARGEDIAFPSVSGKFKTLQLRKDFQKATVAAGLRAGSDVLPAQEPAHELRLRNRLDLFS